MAQRALSKFEFINASAYETIGQSDNLSKLAGISVKTESLSQKSQSLVVLDITFLKRLRLKYTIISVTLGTNDFFLLTGRGH